MIRVATLDDIDELLTLGEALHQESPQYKSRDFDETRTSNLFRQIIDGQGVIFIKEFKGAIVGAFVGGIVRDWFGVSLMSFDYALYVSPEFRKSGFAFELVEAFVSWSIEMNVSRIQCGVATGIDTEQVARLYQGLGFAETGRFFEKEIN